MSSVFKFPTGAARNSKVKGCAVLSLMLFWLSAVADGGGFYVWQRAWTEDVAEAVTAAQGEDRALFVLAGELEREGKAWAWKRPNVPEEIWRDGRVTAVLRAPASAMEDAEGLREVLRREIEALRTGRNACATLSVQLDVDVAERRLSEYGALLGELRRAFPDIELSATLLPVHLAHRRIAEVVKPLDYYVVQVHGIEKPRHRDETYALMKRDVARRAVERAKALGHPFKVALPTYAYVLTFDDAGNFKRLYAEGFPGLGAPSTSSARIAAPDFGLLAEILKMGVEVVWFRLPVASDRWALDMETIRTLENGEIPKAAVELRSEREGGKLVISARFKHQIALDRATVALSWQDAKALRGEFFPLNGTEVDAPHGALPGEISIMANACGQWFPVAFAITGNDLK